MKTIHSIYLPALFWLCPLLAFPQNSGENTELNTTPPEGEIKACQSIVLKPGFSFTASAGKSLTLRIDQSICPPHILEKIMRENISPASDQNYILTRTMTQADGSNYRDVIQYFDGLGREVETVAKNASPVNSYDLVTRMDYDDYGRQTKTWLPSPGDFNDGRYNGSSTAAANYSDTNPYSETVYEKSPLNRPEQQFGPGAVWRTNNRSVKTFYLTNTATGNQSCRQYDMSGDNIKLTGTYAASQLYVTKITDEDNNDSYEFKDKPGRVLLRRRIDTRKTAEKEQQYDTYYIYDDFGNLRCVLPPMASDAMNVTGTTYTPTNQTVADYAYIYRYDGRNRNVVKKRPGCDSVLYVYDKADRLRLSQDGVQRSKSEWTYYKYNALGRQIVTGTFTKSATRAQMQTNVESVATLFESLSGSSDGTCKLYTNDSYPKTSDGTNMKELINLYYDNYDFVSGSDYAFTSGVSDSEYASAKGLQTGSRSALLDESGQYIYRVTRYDAFGRPVQTKSTNTIAGEMDFEYNKYNFTGQVIEKSIKTKTNSVSEKYTYNYDNQGRLQSTWYYLNSDAKKLMDSCTYDMFGRLSAKNVGGVNTATYSYNVRSWQTKQSSPKFTEELFYTSCPRSDVPGMFAGNIIAKQWITSESSAKRGMYYAYDPLDRLISAGSSDGINMTDNKNNYSEFSEYDKNGNFTSLMRSGRFDNGTFGSFDILIPKYSGNRISTVTDNGIDQTASDLMEFKAGSGQYVYDANGRMIADSLKGMNIEYNFVNLPRRITFQTGNKVEYVYDAMGTKFQTNYFAMGAMIDIITNEIKYIYSLRQQIYAANKIYATGLSTRVLTQEGYVDNLGTAYSHYYYVKDYQGNNRLVLNSSGDIVQATNHYAFGASYAEKPARTDQSVQPYKYNGKELDRLQGLDYYDNLARTYDPIVGRFTTMDPMAEKYPWLSPYAYCANNPVNFIDPTGMVIDSLSQKQWDNEKNRVTKQRDKLENKNKNGKNDERIASLNNTLNTMQTAEESEQVYTLSGTSDGIGGVTLNTKTKAINISYKGTANFVHELKHVEQFESRWGHIGFDASTGNVVGQDIYDEVQAYRAQFAYDPSSVTGLSSISSISTMQDILPAWVQGINGGSIYAPGGFANTGISPLYLNSTKEDFIRAYPGNIAIRNLPANFVLKTSYPNLYYKRR